MPILSFLMPPCRGAAIPRLSLAAIAQSVEQLTCNQQVVSSSLTRCSMGLAAPIAADYIGGFTHV